MPYKNFGGHRWKWVCSRATRAKAENVQRRLEAGVPHTVNGATYYGVVLVVVRERKLGSPSALVPTVYDVYARPSWTGKKAGYTLTSNLFETKCRVATYGD